MLQNMFKGSVAHGNGGGYLVAHWQAALNSIKVRPVCFLFLSHPSLSVHLGGAGLVTFPGVFRDALGCPHW
jgi:hypothetical protein